MDDAPDFSELAKLIFLAKKYAKTDGEWDTEVVLAEMRDEERALIERSPALEMPAHWLVEGALFVRRQSDAGRSRKSTNHGRNVQIAAQCIAWRHDPAYDEMSDIQLIVRAGNLPRFNLSKSQARAAVLEGLRDPRNKEKIREFGERGIPNGRRSIFDGSKERRCQTTTSTPHPPNTTTQ